MSFLSSLIGGVPSLIGGIVSNHSARKEAQSNRDFQERMSSTSHTREVQDLRNAGLNPILSANQGASTPVGFGAMQQNPAAGMMEAGSGVYNARTQRMLAKQQLLIGEKTLSKLDADIAKTNSDIQVNSSVSAKNMQDAEESRARSATYPVNISLMKINIQKTMQDIANSKLITDSEVKKNAAIAAEAYSGVGRNQAQAGYFAQQAVESVARTGLISQQEKTELLNQIGIVSDNKSKEAKALQDEFSAKYYGKNAISSIDQFKGAARDLGGFLNSVGIDFRLSNSR